SFGLISNPILSREGQIIAGPWHEAFGFLVRWKIHQEKIESFFPKRGEFSRVRISAPLREIPLIRGYKNEGVDWIEEKTGAKVLKIVPDDAVPSGQIVIEGI
ncbi:MAG: hypothetical protein ABIG67_00775, partial [Pseudomonadota bacterium]